MRIMQVVVLQGDPLELFGIVLHGFGHLQKLLVALLNLLIQYIAGHKTQARQRGGMMHIAMLMKSLHPL